MSRDYPTFLARMAERQTLGVTWGLERVRAALAALGDPHLRVPAVQIAGTNGKGSTAAMAESILRAAGLRTGLFTSPHLVRFTERIAIEGREASADAVAEVGHAVLDLPVPLSYFEVATLIAFVLFERAGVEVAVLETGLGGRLDATTAARAVATGITTVAADHLEVLGPTLPDVAREKAGIARAGVPLIVGVLPPEIEAVVKTAAAAAGSEVAPVGGAGALPAVPALRGRHQAANARVALALARAAGRALGRAISAEAETTGLTTVRWPGRLEELALEGQRVVLDGAHNLEGALALAAWLAEHGGGPARTVLVSSIATDKDAAQILAALAPHAARLVATRSPSPRAAAPELLARSWPGRAEVVEGPVDAMRAALAALDPADPTTCVVVMGSLFLVGGVRAWALGERSDPVFIWDPPATKFAAFSQQA